MKIAILIPVVYMFALVLGTLFFMGGCAKKMPPVKLDDSAVHPKWSLVEPLPDTISDKPLMVIGDGQPTEPANVQTVQETVYFEFDRRDLKDETKAALTDIGKKLLDTKQSVWIVGGCSPEGGAEYNVGLGLSRAKSVKDFLVAYGVSADKIDISSVGEEQLISRDESEYWKDRRCEITVR